MTQNTAESQEEKEKLGLIRQPSTITDVATVAGVTPTTVSMVMRNKPGISGATRDRVLSAVRKLDYRPRQTRGPILNGQVGLIFLNPSRPARIHGEPGSSYLHEMLNGCLAAAEQSGNSLTVSSLTPEQVSAKQLPLAIARGHVDGLIVRGWMPSGLDVVLKEVGGAVVFVDCDNYIDAGTQVQIDNLRAMDQLVQHLCDVGSQHVATITGDMNHLNGRERLAGLRMGLQIRSLVLEDSRVVLEHDFDEASGERGAQELLSRGVSFDTLVCHNDLIAVGALRVLRRAGLSVPGDVRVSGFDNMHFARDIAVPLTTVDPQPYRMGQLATQLLIERIKDPNTQPLHLRQQAKVIVRASTCEAAPLDEADPESK